MSADLRSAMPGQTLYSEVQHNEATASSSAMPAVKRQKVNTTSANLRSAMPLAERVRPTEMSQILGQEVVEFLTKIVEDGERVPSIILWGG